VLQLHRGIKHTADLDTPDAGGELMRLLNFFSSASLLMLEYVTSSAPISEGLEDGRVCLHDRIDFFSLCGKLCADDPSWSSWKTKTETESFMINIFLSSITSSGDRKKAAFGSDGG
jgi:hypothetical protein